MNKKIKKVLLTFGTVTALATFSANLSSSAFTVHADDSTNTNSNSDSSSSNSQDNAHSKKIADLQKKIDKWTKLEKKAQSYSKKHKKYKGPSMYTIQKKIINYTQDLKLLDGSLIPQA